LAVLASAFSTFASALAVLVSDLTGRVSVWWAVLTSGLAAGASVLATLGSDLTAFDSNLANLGAGLV
jgi:hypothetical protein